MIKSELLEEKWRTQRKMAEEAGYDIKKMLDNAEKIVQEMVEKQGIKLRYAKLQPSTLKL